MKTSKRALLRWFKQEDWHIICYWRICSCVYDNKKVYKRLSNCMWTFMTTSLEELITRVLLGRPKRTLGQKLNIFRTSVKKDGAGRLEIQILCYEERPTDVRVLTGKREKGGLAQEEPLGGVVEECLASQLT
jgi:hypothetical protein